MRRCAPCALPVFVASFALVAIVSTAGAATLPAGFVETQVVSGLSAPTAMAFAPDGRLFVAEQGGRLRVIKNGTLLAQPFLTVPVDSFNERGLLGVAIDPAFASNGYVYVYYTATTPTVHNRVSRFTASGDVAAAGSEVPILDLNDLSSASNHNGGAIHFGPDGKLYIGVGDNANGANSQTLTNLLGKILRINPDGTIPSDNPFYASATGINRAIWALGLRNPYTFAFQPGTTRMFINDVGENTWEEIDDGIAGSNYGWPTTEGPTTDPRFRSPIFWYGHGSSSTTGCAITGGAFYDPPVVQFPTSYVGTYFFADLCSGWIRNLDPTNGNVVRDFATGAAAPVDLAVASDGTLYYLTRGGASGSVYRVSSTASVAPTITTQPTSQAVSAGSPVNFSVAASGTPPLSYQWQRNAVDIPGATSSTYTIASAQSTDSGARFRVRVSNAAGNTTSDEAVLTVNKTGQTISFGALANMTYGDADFTLSANASSGLPVSFAAAGNCTANVAAVHVTGAGSCTITATQPGDANWNAAPPVSQSFSIAKANQAVSFGAPADRTYGDADFTLSANASSGLPVGFAAAGNCTVNLGTIHVTGAGTCTITATQPGDANWNAAPTVSHSFSIAKADQTISFAPLANKTVGDPDFTVNATASSALVVGFGAAGGCTVSGTLVHLTGAGSCTLTASQSGDADWNPAPTVSRNFTITAAASTTPPPRCKVPTVVGKTLERAKTLLKKSHCRAGKVTYARSRQKKQGIVVAQSRRAGRVLQAGSKIDLVVSQGRKK